MAQDVAAIADELAAELIAVGKEERAVNEKRYLKSEIEHFGVTVPEIRKLAKRVCEGAQRPDEERID